MNYYLITQHIILLFKNKFKFNVKLKTNKKILFGFTFSFPIKQPNINTGILLQWNKLFNIPNVIGKNITNLMHESFKKY